MQESSPLIGKDTHQQEPIVGERTSTQGPLEVEHLENYAAADERDTAASIFTKNKLGRQVDGVGLKRSAERPASSGQSHAELHGTESLKMRENRRKVIR